MAIVTKYVRNSLTGDNAPVNKELEKIETALASKLDRKPEVGQANQMEEELDMNGYRILNYPAAVEDSDLITKGQVAAEAPVQSVNGQTGDVELSDFVKFVQEEVPTGNVVQGTRWYKPSESTSYVYYVDADGGQWVQESVSNIENTFNNVKSFATTAELQATTPLKTGQRAENRERANAQYVLAPAGYVAQAGDITAANGRVWELIYDLSSAGSDTPIGGVKVGDLVENLDVKEYPPFLVDQGESSSELQSYVSANRGGRDTTIGSLINMPDNYPKYTGQGDENPINVTGAGGFRYTYSTGEFDDHAHRLVEKTRFSGTGTQSLYIQDQGSYSEFSRNTFQEAENGLTIRDAYTNNGYKNHYKACVNGLVLDNTTSFTEYEIYARGNTEAAIKIQGVTNEDVNLIGGAIEGNRGSAIKVESDVGSQFRLNIQNVYFELDGDTFGGASTPSIDVPLIDESVHTRFIGGKLSYNSVAGWISGDYNFGYNVIFNGTKISGVLNSHLMKFADGCRLDDATLNNNSEPAFVADWDPSVKFTSGFGATRGYVFSCQVIGKSNRASPIENTTRLSHPYISTLGAGPTVTEDIDSDYGDGSWTKAEFSPVAGSYSNNSVYIGNTVDGNQKQRMYSFMIKSDRDTTIQFLESQTSTAIQSTHQLKAGVIYKMICVANKIVSGTQRLVIFPTIDNAPVISVLCLRQSQFNDPTVTRMSSLISQTVRGTL